MPLTKPTYLVQLTEDGDPERVTVTSGDQLRAELEGNKLHVPDLPFHVTVMWLWASCARQGLTELSGRDWLTNPPEWAAVKGGDVDVDPTQEAAGAPASGSHASTVTPDSGLTPS